MTIRTADIPSQEHTQKAPYEDSKVKLEKLVKPYYEALEKGKVLRRRCTSCGHIEWPPVLRLQRLWFLCRRVAGNELKGSADGPPP